MEKETLIEAVKMKIKARGLQKQHVAKQIGTSPVKFSQSLSGTRNFTPEEVSGLITYLNLNR